MMATFTELLNYSLPDNAAEDSISILPAVLAKDAQKIRRLALTTHTGGHVFELGSFSIRQGKNKEFVVRLVKQLSETYINEGEKNKLSMIETHFFLGIIE